MDYLDKVWENIKDWAKKLIEILLGGSPEPESELIPIPVDQPKRR
ncbi:MAG: hypothetical protein WCO81_08075 [Cyanobacteriota bacterium ELA615]|jgi:hypothetical protein